MVEEDLAAQIELLKKTVSGLEDKIRTLETNSFDDQTLPKTSLLDQSFFKRAFTIFGHNLVAGLIISIPLYIIMITIMLLIGGFHY